MGGEFIAFTSHLAKHGIQIRYFCPHTHQQNGVAKRKHHHIVKTSLTLFAHAKMPFKFWYEAFTTSTFLINNMPLVAFHFMSSFERLYHKKPKYNFFKTFGSSCFPFLRDYSKHKFNFHTSKCIFICYSQFHRGYKCLHPSCRIYVSRHVEFNELEFPYIDLFPTRRSSHKSSMSSCMPLSTVQSIVTKQLGGNSLNGRVITSSSLITKNCPTDISSNENSSASNLVCP